MRNCKIIKPGMKMPCYEKKKIYCPFFDMDFMDVLKFYINAIRLPALFNDVGSSLNNTLVDGLGLADIAGLFDGHEWVDYVALYLIEGRILLTREQCQQMKAARATWWKKLAPMNYHWHGDPREKPERYGV